MAPPPVEDAAFDAILQALIAPIVSLPATMVRPRWQLIPTTVPEATVNWMAIGATDTDPEKGNVVTLHSATGGPVDGMSTTYERNIVTVLCSFYGPNAKGNAERLRSGLMVAQNREPLYFNHMALVEKPGPTRLVPDIINNQTVRRADVTFLLQRTMTNTWPIDNLIEVQGAIYSDDGAVEPFDVSQS